MSIERENKVAVVNEIKEKLQKAKSMVVVNYGGITVVKDIVLRAAFRKENVDYKVYKNRLVMRALNELGYEIKEDDLKGTNSIAISYEDETAGPRILKKFMEENKIMEFKLGLMNNKIVDVNYVNKIANLPSKQVLMSMLLNVLNAPVKGVCVALNAVATKKEQ